MPTRRPRGSGWPSKNSAALKSSSPLVEAEDPGVAQERVDHASPRSAAAVWEPRLAAPPSGGAGGP